MHTAATALPWWLAEQATAMLNVLVFKVEELIEYPSVEAGVVHVSATQAVEVIRSASK